MTRKRPGKRRDRINPAERTEITPKLVHDLLKEIMKAGVVPGLESPRLISLAQDLGFFQLHFYRAVSENWKLGRQRRKRLAEGLTALNEALPSLIDDYERAHSWAEEDRLTPAAQNFALGVKLLRSLALAAGDVQLCPLFDKDPQHPQEDRWEYYGQPIMDTLGKNVPGMTDEAHYRFIAKVAPAITGESVTAAAVKTAVTKGRLVNWCNLPSEIAPVQSASRNCTNSAS